MHQLTGNWIGRFEAGRERDFRTGSDRRGQASTLRLLFNGESGQILPWAAVLVTLFLGMSGLVVDVGHMMVVQHQLQASADAAALAAAETLPNTTYSSVGQTYSAGSGSKNIYTGLAISGGTATITPKCLTTVSNWGAPCNSTTPNAIAVTQTAVVQTFFAGIFGVKTVTVSATSTAAGKGAVPLPYNVVILVDSTLSMNAYDSNCGATQMNCALSGVQTLLQSLYPTEDNVALFTFPNVTGGTVSIDSSCTTSVPSSYTTGSGKSATTTNYNSSGRGSSGYYYSMLSQTPYPGVPNAMPYTFPPIPSDTSGYAPPSGTWGPTYQVVGFSNDFRASNSATSLSATSSLVKAAGGKSGCQGMQPSNYDGDYGTYYAGAIYAAQAALLAEQASNPGSKNVMVILGDGDSTAPNASGSPDSASASMPADAAHATQSLSSNSYTYPSSWQTSTGFATSNGSYPSWNGECSQAVDAAQYAATYSGNPTMVYTVAYGASTSGCSSDRSYGAHKGVSPCGALQQMSTGWSSGIKGYFYSDYNTTGGDTGCQAASKNNQVTSLNQIFQAIATDLTSVRLIPNNTY